MSRIIFHIDVNSAFLSWEAVERLQNDPSALDVRTIPSAIGGDMSRRHGIILAKSIPAKKYGVTTGEPITDALRKCPNLLLIPPNHALYSHKSAMMMQLLREYTDQIEQVSIDECYMDFSSIASRYSSPIEAATQMKDTIKDLFGFTVNVGISDRKVLAKMASDFKKPDLIHTLYHDEIRQKMWHLPVSSLYMCGKSSVEALRKLEIITIGDLACANPDILCAHLKSHGKQLWEYANGIDDSVVAPEPERMKGVGNSTTLSKDAVTREDALLPLRALADSVGKRLRGASQMAGMISVEIKYHDFRTVSHQATLSTHTNSSDLIYRTACQLFDQIWDDTPIRLLGIRTSKLQDEDAPRQISLFELDNITSTPPMVQAAMQGTMHSSTQKQQKLDAALDSIRSKYGEASIVRGSFLKKE